MNKQDMKEKIISTVKEAIGNNASFSGEMLVLESNDIDHIAEESADKLIEAGYINGADFVEWLKASAYIKPHLINHTYGSSIILHSVSYEDLDEALKEYMKGE